MTSINVSVAQFEAQRDVKENIATIGQLLSEAPTDCDLVVLPENSMYSDPLKEHPQFRYSESLEGNFVSQLKNLAAVNKVNILAGITETNDKDPQRPFNTLVRLTPEGTLDGIYRKIHLYDAFGFKESDKVTPADISEPLLFTISGVTVGALTCYDLRFPEIVRWVALHDADLIALPAAWAAGPAKESHWETLIRARAIENTLYFAGSGQTGPSCAGQSLIVDPMGVTLASAGESAGVVATATIGLERLNSVRQTNPSLKNRRFDVSPALVTDND
jgi:predicted amidohydrolase